MVGSVTEVLTVGRMRKYCSLSASSNGPKQVLLCAVIFFLCAVESCSLAMVFHPVLTESQARAPRLWWSMARLLCSPAEETITNFSGCSEFSFSAAQLKYCANDSSLELMEVLARASLRTAKACRRAFEKYRWNCPVFAEGPLFGRAILKRGTKEAAFIHALMAAALAYETTSACTRGLLPSYCTCSKVPPFSWVERRLILSPYVTLPIGKLRFYNGIQNYGWRLTPYGTTCSDNIEFGSTFAEEFMSTTHFSVWGEQRRILNEYNEQLGIKTVKDGMRYVCGGCLPWTFGTLNCSRLLCWRELPDFTWVADTLMTYYRNALQIIFPKNATTGERKTAKYRSAEVVARSGQDGSQALVYSKDLDYCRRKPAIFQQLDIVSAAGRNCTLDDPDAQDSCDRLCCGDYSTETVTNLKDCNCHFVYCCRLHCDLCNVTVTRSWCK